jgi:diguanylate cyclase (GGDEF)-like protein
LRETDVIARYGGDEFVVLLPQTKADGALHVAERIRRAIAAMPLDTHGKDVATTVSIGIAAYPGHGAELAVIMNRADQALYTSKKRGRNRSSFSGDPEPAT